MKTTQHTPGPWLTNEGSSAIQIFTATQIIEGRDGEQGPFETKMLADVFNHGNIDESVANARLIASAPEMLEALKAWAKAWPQHLHGDDYGIHAAIARAEGRA